MMHLPLILPLLFGLTFPALAAPVMCAVDAGTDRHYCVDPKAVDEEGNYRASRLYEGGPKEVRATNFTAHADCAGRILVLKDRQGVKFGGGRFSDTQLSGDLGRILCQATPRKKKHPR